DRRRRAERALAGQHPCRRPPGLFVPRLRRLHGPVCLRHRVARDGAGWGGVAGEGLPQPRRFAVFAWAFLTIGIVLGAWWSYQVLGWGGFWGWDPVENAALLPWLTATAYLHSSMLETRR